jgi:putative copper export protein
MPASDKFAYGGSTALGRIVTNFVHDMSTGIWFACLLVLWVISSRSAGAPAEAAVVLSSASQAVFWLLVASLVGLTVTGALRLVYWRAETPPEMRSTKRSALIIKHAAFLVVYGLGTAWAALLVFG